jgi:hypothetical protein
MYLKINDKYNTYICHVLYKENWKYSVQVDAYSGWYRVLF